MAYRMPGLLKKRTHKRTVCSGPLYLWMLLSIRNPSSEALRWVAMETKGYLFYLFGVQLCTIAWDIFPINLKLCTGRILVIQWGCHPTFQVRKHSWRGVMSKTQMGLETRSLVPWTKLTWSMQVRGRIKGSSHVEYIVAKLQSSPSFFFFLSILREREREKHNLLFQINLCIH